MRVKEKIFRRIIREELEVQDFNLQAAIDQAKEAGFTGDEIQAVLDASQNDEERIVMLRDLGSEYPASVEDTEQ